MDVLLRDLPDDVHTELARRAAERDMSLRAYLTEVLSTHASTPSMGQWIERVGRLGSVHSGGPTGPDLVADSRADDDHLVAR